MATEQVQEEKMQTLNIKPETKKTFRELKWGLQKDLNWKSMTDNEAVALVSKDEAHGKK